MAFSHQKHGLKVYLRDPDSYTPHLETRQYLLLGSDATEKHRQIAKFSARDARVYPEYETWLERIGKGVVACECQHCHSRQVIFNLN